LAQRYTWLSVLADDLAACAAAAAAAPSDSATADPGGGVGPAGVGGLAPLAADTVAAAAGRGGLDLPAVAVAAPPSAAEAKVHWLDAD
jgi:hypothetical protein